MKKQFWSVLAVALVCGLAIASAAKDKRESKKMHTLEIRSYNLKPGTRARFQELAEKQAFPMLQRAHIDVVSYGPSEHDENSFFLMRSFPSVAAREKAEDDFYGSDEWKNGPRQAVLDCIESYTTVVMEVDDATLAGLRKTSVGAKVK